MRSRGTNFSNSEIDILLNIISDVLPIGTEEWKEVERRHRQNYPQHDRSRETLKRKFRQLYGTRPDTGNPTIPEAVRKAKNILEDIKSKQNVSDGEGSGGSDFETSSSGSDGEGTGTGEESGGGTGGGTGGAAGSGANGGGADGGGAAVIVKKGSRGGGRASKKQKQEKEEVDLLHYLILEGAKDKAERERNRLEELRIRREDRKAERRETRMMMMMMMGMFGQSQNRSSSVTSGSVANYSGFMNDSSSDESDGKPHAV